MERRKGLFKRVLCSALEEGRPKRKARKEVTDRLGREPDRSRKKVHSPTVTMATDKGWRCRAEQGRKGERKDKGKEREAGDREECLLPSSSVLPVLSVQFINT